jgi:hypothetical protein
MLVLGGLPPTVHRDPALPTVTAGEPLHPYQRVGTTALLMREEKEIIGTITRILQEVTLMELQEQNKPQNTKYRGTRD